MASSSFSTYLDVTKSGSQSAVRRETEGIPDPEATANAAKVLAAARDGASKLAEFVANTELPPADVVSSLDYLAKNGLVQIEVADGVDVVSLTDSARQALAS